MSQPRYRAVTGAAVGLLVVACQSSPESGGNGEGSPLLDAFNEQDAVQAFPQDFESPQSDGEFQFRVDELYAETEDRQIQEPVGSDPVLEGDLEDILAAVELQQDQAPVANPYEEFGERIVWYQESGFIMKPFSFPLGVGAKVQQLIAAHSGIPVHASLIDDTGDTPEAAQAPGSIVLHLLTAQDSEAFTAPRSPGLSQPQAVSLSDWLVVVAQPEELRKVQRFIKAFVTDIRQIQIEAKIVEISTYESFDYGIRPADLGTPIFGLPNPGTLVGSVDFSFGNTVDSAEALFGISAVFDEVSFSAILEMISTDQSASIIAQPKAAVREGARAELVEIERIPVLQLSAINSNGNFTSNVVFKEVGVQMYVVPRVVGKDTVVLNVDAEVSQVTGTAVTFVQTAADGASSTIGIPEISRRKAATTVRLEPGQGLVIGGLISERTLQRERKVPVLGDIPVLGYLFKSQFSEVERTNVLFFIYPRILQGMDMNPEY